MTISGIPITDLTMLEGIANGFNRSIFYEKGQIPTEITMRTHMIFKDEGLDMDTEFTTMALTDLTTVEYRNPEGWKILVDFILSTGNPIAIALNCEDINFVIFNYKDHVHIQFSDKNVKTQHQTEKILEGFNRPYNINLNHNESEVVFGTFKIVLRDNDDS